MRIIRLIDLMEMEFATIKVECYSGHKLNERPTAFTYEGLRWEIREIVDCWYEGGIDPARPEVSYFKVKTMGGSIYILRYLSLFDSWSINPLSKPDHPPRKYLWSQSHHRTPIQPVQLPVSASPV